MRDVDHCEACGDRWPTVPVYPQQRTTFAGSGPLTLRAKIGGERHNKVLQRKLSRLFDDLVGEGTDGGGISRPSKPEQGRLFERQVLRL